MNTLNIILLAFIAIESITLGFVILNLMKKVEKYEDFFQEERNKINLLLKTLKEIDSKQWFEKDDVVGSLFEQIKETILFFTLYEEENNDQSEEKKT